MSINRNIVECKYLLRRCIRDGFTVLIETLWNVNLILYDDRTLAISINRNIVECKSGTLSDVADQAAVLIETLWNVNFSFYHAASCLSQVLIETLWNVNIVEILQDQALTHRINRNIVECKYRIYSLH